MLLQFCCLWELITKILVSKRFDRTELQFILSPSPPPPPHTHPSSDCCTTYIKVQKVFQDRRPHSKRFINTKLQYDFISQEENHGNI